MSEGDMSEVFALRDVHMSFANTGGGEALHVLRGAQLRVAAGEVVALLGRSGSGKSCLLHVAGLLAHPTSGEVFIKGASVGASDKVRTRLRLHHIGFVYQFHNLLPEFTAAENIMIPARLAGASKHEAHDKALALLTRLNVAERAEHLPAQMSGGEQQRVALARALVNQPQIILADEPTGSLDTDAAQNIGALLHELAHEQKVAILIATHDSDLASRADRILNLKAGRVE